MTLEFLILAVVLLCGCLSVDDLPELREQAPSSACFDRGSYDIDGQTVQGLSATCDADRVCIDGTCVAEPRCDHGELECEVLLSPSSNDGVQSNIVAIGNNIYLIDTRGGETDEDMPSGALRQAWVDGGSSLIESGLEIGPATRVELRAQAGLMIADVFEFDVETDHLVLSPVSVEAAGDKHLLFRTGKARPLCVSSEGVAFMRGGELGLWSREVAGVDRHYEVPALRNCFVENRVLWGQALNLAATLVRLEIDSGQLTTFTAIDELIGVYQDSPVQLRDDRISVARLGPDQDLVWRDVLTITEPRHGEILLRGDEVTWVHAGDTRAQTVILRSHFDSTASPRVLVETPQSLRADDVVQVRATDNAVLWEVIHDGGPSELHCCSKYHCWNSARGDDAR